MFFFGIHFSQTNNPHKEPWEVWSCEQTTDCQRPQEAGTKQKQTSKQPKSLQENIDWRVQSPLSCPISTPEDIVTLCTSIDVQRCPQTSENVYFLPFTHLENSPVHSSSLKKKNVHAVKVKMAQKIFMISVSCQKVQTQLKPQQPHTASIPGCSPYVFFFSLTNCRLVY